MAVVVGGYGKSENLAGAMYDCVLCHTPQATNVATPKSSFTKVEAE